MKIYSMTATFGKLNHENLTLKPGLNVIQAPNEWGKSTWCAFLTAMLYGLDSRSHSTKSALSDKERYTPWSGVPMTGRIDLNWNGRDITIERKSKGRTVFGDFRAYETESGLPIPELNGQNCGQMLLGVEKSVFTRSAMIRLTDLPVTQDEALRRRLNALVTTGDDSGTGDQLERKLRDLKNRCRYNRTGLLPQAEEEAAEVDQKLRELDALEAQSRTLRQKCSDLEDQLSRLENHRTALRFQAAQENARRLQTTKQQLLLAEYKLQAQQMQCDSLPPREEVRDTLAQLQNLQTRWTQFQMEPSQPEIPSEHPLFHGLSDEEARNRTNKDIAQYKKLTKPHPLLLILGILAVAAGICTYTLVADYRNIGIAVLAFGALLCVLWTVRMILNRNHANRIAEHYGSRNSDDWAKLAEDYVNLIEQRMQTEAQRQASLSSLRDQTRSLCRDRSLAEVLWDCREAMDQWDALDAAQREVLQCKGHRDLLKALAVEAPAPRYPDELTLSDRQTVELQNQLTCELRESQHRLGQCQGQMEGIGSRTALESRRNALIQRIRQLEDTYSALTLALTTLESARSTLQRRFAPRITGRARELLARLTEGRYDRLVLGSDLTLHATAENEETLRSALWRSDGTADLLYLALRLAVASELASEAPLILDDALVRFDDHRLQQAMAVLKEEATQRQIILFTCHSRESQYM